MLPVSEDITQQRQQKLLTLGRDQSDRAIDLIFVLKIYQPKD